jgi:hypothetical protein
MTDEYLFVFGIVCIVLIMATYMAEGIHAIMAVMP